MRLFPGLYLPALLLAMSWPTDGLAQPVEPMTGAQIRALTREAQARAGGADKTEMLLGLDSRVRARWGDFESFPVPLVRRDDLTIVLSTPYMTYRRMLADFLRIDRPIADIPWIAAVVIAVEPARIDAPDIARIVVERGGTPVPPLENRLRPMTFTNGLGQQAPIHAGEVRFPLSAFAPGAPVTITATTSAGVVFATTLDDAQLPTLK